MTAQRFEPQWLLGVSKNGWGILDDVENRFECLLENALFFVFVGLACSSRKNHCQTKCSQSPEGKSPGSKHGLAGKTKVTWAVVGHKISR